MKAKAGIEMRYGKGKASGFKHPADFQEYLHLHKDQKAEIEKLKEKLGTLCEKFKGLAEAEDKSGQEFTTQSSHGSQHAKCGQVLRLFGECQVALSALRYQYVAVLEGCREEMKSMETVELKHIGNRMDQANRSLVTWQYWDANKDGGKAKDEDIRYQGMATEIAALIVELRAKKESLEPQICLRALQGEVVFFRQACSLVENAELQIRTLGPVSPTEAKPWTCPANVVVGRVNPSSNDDSAPTHSQPVTSAPPSNPYGSQPSANPYGSQPSAGYAQPAPNAYAQPQPPPPVAYAPPPAPAQPRARALYTFQKQNPPELSFNAGDILNLISTEGQWWTAELNGQQGLIPFNYVERI